MTRMTTDARNEGRRGREGSVGGKQFGGLESKKMCVGIWEYFGTE